jgi:diacylglycerol O-acyltransferase
MERMNTLDSGFFFVEHDNVPMHLGSLAVFEGPAPAYDDLITLVEAKLPLVPRYRQVVRTTPLQVFRPMWVDDEHFEITYHVRHAAVPAPGGPEQLRALAARLFAQRLDRARPLFEEWLLEGLEDGRWALLSKVHHCMVDGIGSTDLMTLVFDTEPDATPPEPADWQPEPAPSVASQVADGLRDVLTWPLRQLASAPDLLRRLSEPGELAGYSSGLTDSAKRLSQPSAASLNGPIGPHRRWDWTTVRLSEVKEIRSAHGGTVNDVLLAATTRAFRDLLEKRGELTEELVVRSLVPVSIRGQDERGVVTNRVSAVLANLPVSEPDPVQRLKLIREQMDSLKHTYQAVSAEILTGMLGFASPMWLALGSRAAFRIPQPLVQTVTTNVPGPHYPLYILGRRMEAAYPYVPIGNSVRISIAMFSYLDTISFGITTDYDFLPDLDIMIDGIGHGLAELGAHPQQAAPAPKPARPARKTTAPAHKPAGPGPKPRSQKKKSQKKKQEGNS